MQKVNVKKVAILTPTFFRFSGIDRVVELQAEEYAKKGWEVTIFCLKGDISTRYATVEKIGCPESPSLERLYRLLFFLDIATVRKYSRRMKDFDMIISHLYPMNVIAHQARKRYPLTYIYHNAGIAYPHLFHGLERLYMEAFRLLTRLTIRNADEIISISHFLKRELQKEGLDSRVEHCKIDAKRFTMEADPESVRRKHSISDSPLFLYVGRVSPHKGIHLLLKAFAKVREELPDAKLLIVGKKTFDRYGKQLDRIACKGVLFTGFVPEELPAYYAAADVYVTASLWEGYDLPIKEAEAVGTPSVAFAIGAHPEVLTKGAMVTENDIEGFAIAMVSEHRKRVKGK